MPICHDYVYNVAPGRALKTVEHELEAMAATGPRHILLMEALGYRLPDLPDYTLIHDTSTDSRGNVAAYVRSGSRLRWWHIDHTTTWPRTDHPGTHPPRSTLVVVDGRMQVLVGHNPPPHIPNVVKAQGEVVSRLSRAMNPRLRQSWHRWTKRSKAYARRRPRLLGWDSNGVKPAQELATRVRGTLTGAGVLNVVTVRVKVLAGRYFTALDLDGTRVPMGSDHGRVFRVDYEVADWWLR